MKIFTQSMLQNLTDAAEASVRLRVNHDIHQQPGDPVQRFFNVMLPGTYVRPHRHITPPRWELFLLLQGRLAVLLFGDDGRVLERQELNAGGQVFGVEIEAECWHAMVVLERALVFEVKQGPYHADHDKRFASWAPAEGDPDCGRVVDWYRTAQPQDRLPHVGPPVDGD